MSRDRFIRLALCWLGLCCLGIAIAWNAYGEGAIGLLLGFMLAKVLA